MNQRPGGGSSDGQHWRIVGRYRSLDLEGSVSDAARAVVNLVNLQGAGPLGINPPGCLEEVREALDAIPGIRAWRRWWLETSGERIDLSGHIPAAAPEPVHITIDTMSKAKASIGVNVGGSFVRIVSVNHGKVTHEESFPVSELMRTPKGAVSMLDFVRAIRSQYAGREMSTIGIAWSAPRTKRGLRAASVQSRSLGELGVLMDRGELDRVLSALLDCPVKNWNDGEAVAAGEAVARGNVFVRPLLVLKLGNSVASGIALERGVSLLPTQLSKCLLSTQPLVVERHPSVGLEGSFRDFVGAAPMTAAFSRLDGRLGLDYADFCEALARQDPRAQMVLRRTAAAIAEAARLVGSTWRPVDVVLTGKNVEHSWVGGLLTSYVAQSGARISPALLPVDTSAAIGAIALSLAEFN